MSELPPVPTPEKTLKYKLAGEEREAVMTYGLLNELVSLVRDLQEVADFYTSPDLRNKSILSVVAERTKTGKVLTKTENVDDLDIEIEDVDAILAWVTTHVTAFFIRSMNRLSQGLSESLPPQPENNLISTPSGSPS